VLALPFDTVIPGHGQATSRRSIERYRDFMTSLWKQTATIRDRGGSVDDAVKLVNIEEFGLSPLWWVPTLNRGFVIHRAWQELTAPRTAS
jgi:hypothetical protein